MPRHAIFATPHGTEAVLDAIGERLPADTLRVSTHFGPLEALVGSANWRRMEVLAGAGFKCGAREMDAAPMLLAIVVFTLGYEGVDVAAASARGILVVNGQTPENYESMAEATVMLILALLYDLKGAEARLRAGEWHGRVRSRMLKGNVVGIIGFGNIARGVIDRLAGWGVSILVHTRRPPAEGYGAARFGGLEEVIANSDILLPLASLNESSEHLLDASRLASMREGAVLVNVARGGLIDEAALAPLVESGRIGRLALDVFETEPLSAGSPLRRLPDAILTPHDIGHSRESSAGMIRVACANLAAVANGEVPSHVIDATAIPRWLARARLS